MRKTLLALSIGGLVAAGLAVPANAAHEGLEVTGLTQNGRLVSFLADEGATTSSTKITGVTLGDKIVAIDYRPATGDLYGVAVAGTQGYLYLIDDETGAATLLGTGFPVTGSVSIDFNPVVDLLRVVSSEGDNLRVRPTDGGRADAPANDGRLTPGFTVVGAGYLNNDTDPATGTTLFDVDAAGDQLLTQAPPNAGTLNPVGALGVDAQRDTGFDIYTETVGTTVTNVALLSVNKGSTTTTYVVNTTTGAVNPASASVVDSKPAVVDIAIPTDQ